MRLRRVVRTHQAAEDCHAAAVGEGAWGRRPYGAPRDAAAARRTLHGAEARCKGDDERARGGVVRAGAGGARCAEGCELWPI